MAATDFIVAIELGSTEITGIAGKKNADGSVNILAYAAEKSSDCIKKGVIYNIDKTTQRIISIIKELEDKLQAAIKKVYVGIGGLSVRSIRNTESKQLAEDTKISQAIIDSMLQNNSELPLLDYEILAVEPQEYKVGNNLLTEPVGIPADNIEGNFLNIIGRNSLKTNIKQCFSHNGYEIADFIMAPMATANTVLTTNEKRSGCALVDIGADTTTVSVYKNNILRHLSVIPLGGSNITKDICSKQIEEEDAEQLKKRFASAYTEHKDDEEKVVKDYTIEGRCSIPSHQLEDIVEARVNEILANVYNQLKLSNYSDSLLAGIVVTGGASNMPNIDKAITHATKIEKVRIAKSGEVATGGNVDLPKNGTFNTLIGILMAGKENCCRIDPRKGHQLDFIDETDNGQKAINDQNKVQNSALAAELAREKEEAEQRALAEARKKECDELVRTASQLIIDRSYTAALETLKAAKLLDVETKRQEIASLENEATRLLDEAERVRRIKEAQLKAEKEKEMKRREQCKKILDEIEEKLEDKKLKEAAVLLEEAKDFNFTENKAKIDELEERIKAMKKQKLSIFDKIRIKLTNASEEIFDGGIK